MQKQLRRFQPVIPNTQRAPCPQLVWEIACLLWSHCSCSSWELALKASFTKMYCSNALLLFKSRFKCSTENVLFAARKPRNSRHCINICLLIKCFVTVIFIRRAMNGFIGDSGHENISEMTVLLCFHAFLYWVPVGDKSTNSFSPGQPEWSTRHFSAIKKNQQYDFRSFKTAVCKCLATRVWSAKLTILQ